MFDRKPVTLFQRKWIWKYITTIHLKQENIFDLNSIKREKKLYDLNLNSIKRQKKLNDLNLNSFRQETN